MLSSEDANPRLLLGYVGYGEQLGIVLNLIFNEYVKDMSICQYMLLRLYLCKINTKCNTD